MTPNAVGALVALPWLAVLVASLLALAVLCQVLLSGILARARWNLERQPLRCGLIGLVNVLFFGLVAAALIGTHLPGVRLLGAIVGTLLLGLVAIGLVAIGRLLGERLRPGDDPIRQLLLGTLTLCLSLLVPVVGWYLLATIVALAGSGATILALHGAIREKD